MKTKRPDADAMESVLAGLDMFKDGSDRVLISSEAKEDVRTARELAEAAEVRDEDDEPVSGTPSLPLAVESDLDAETLLEEEPPTDAVGLKLCCAKLRAALRAETTLRRNLQSEVLNLRERNLQSQRYIARQNLEVQSLEQRLQKGVPK